MCFFFEEPVFNVSSSFHRQCRFTINSLFRPISKTFFSKFDRTMKFVRSFRFNHSIVPFTISTRSVFVKDITKRWLRSLRSTFMFVVHRFQNLSLNFAFSFSRRANSSDEMVFYSFFSFNRPTSTVSVNKTKQRSYLVRFP